MLDKDTKTRINNARDVLVGKVPNPASQVEQITIALIYKFMDDIDNDLIEWGSSKTYFTGEYEKYKWSNLLSNSLSGETRLKLYSEALEQMSKNENIPQLFRDIFKNAFLPYRDPETLKLFLKEIDWFDYHNSEKLGDAFEYLLLVMSSQGDAGQFRTPRHIIDFIVDIVRPQKHERILDPACGTAGFLISAFKYIMDSNKNAGTELTPEEREALVSNFSGYDISPDMVKLSLVNLYLHGFQDPHIYEYDTLTSEEKWGDKYDVILANPPFMTPKGGIRPHSRFISKAKKSEVLFVEYMIEHLMPNGRAGIIVPEGIIFQSGTAYKNLRKELVEGKNLWAVVSLPAGVFNPYSGVKTSILLLDKEIAKKTDKILFVDIKNDGFDLGAQRKRINGCDLPDALSELIKYHDSLISGEEYIPESEMFNAVEIVKISEKGEYNLSGNRYKEIKLVSLNHTMVELGEVCDILDKLRKPITKSDRIEGKYPYYGATGILDYINDYIFDERLVLVGEDGAKWGSGDKTAFIAEGKYWVNNHAHVLKPISTKIIDTYLVEILNNMDLSPYITGVTVPKLNQQKLKEIKIPLPPLEIQKKIVKEIESYQNIIECAKNIVKSYKPSFKINPDWKTVELGDVANFKRGPFGGSLKKEIFVLEGYKVYEQKNAINDNFEIGDYYITEEKFNEMKSFEVKAGDLIISCSGTMGKIAIVPDNIEKGIINQALLKLTPENLKLLPKYLKLSLELPEIQKHYFEDTSGAAIKNVASVKTLKTIKIPLPPLEEQQKIVAQIEKEQNLVNANKELIEIYEHKINEKINEIWGN